MRRRFTKNSMQAMLVLSPAFIDCLAIPLLVLAGRHQHHFDQLPVVTRDTGQAVDKQTPEKIKPHRIELGSDTLKLDGQSITWDQLPQIAAQDTESKLLVAVNTDAQGNGSISSLLRLSALAAQHNFSQRVFVVSREPEASVGNSEPRHD